MRSLLTHAIALIGFSIISLQSSTTQARTYIDEESIARFCQNWQGSAFNIVNDSNAGYGRDALVRNYAYNQQTPTLQAVMKDLVDRGITAAKQGVNARDFAAAEILTCQSIARNLAMYEGTRTYEYRGRY